MLKQLIAQNKEKDLLIKQLTENKTNELNLVNLNLKKKLHLKKVD